MFMKSLSGGIGKVVMGKSGTRVMGQVGQREWDRTGRSEDGRVYLSHYFSNHFIPKHAPPFNTSRLLSMCTCAQLFCR